MMDGMRRHGPSGCFSRKQSAVTFHSAHPGARARKGLSLMSILEAVEAGLKDFQPKTHRQFLVFNIARRFDDLDRLAAYLNICDRHPKNVLLEAARLAERYGREEGTSPIQHFFDLLAGWERKETL
jgi:hypothetical protein